LKSNDVPGILETMKNGYGLAGEVSTLNLGAELLNVVEDRHAAARREGTSVHPPISQIKWARVPCALSQEISLGCGFPYDRQSR